MTLAVKKLRRGATPMSQKFSKVFHRPARAGLEQADDNSTSKPRRRLSEK
jgi:hypothetical protein